MNLRLILTLLLFQCFWPAQWLAGQTGAEDCLTSFVRRFGSSGINEEAYCITPFCVDRYLFGGREGDHSILLLFDGAGNLLDQRAFNFTNGNDFISNLIVDSEGYLVGIARDGTGFDSIPHVIFRYDWQNNNFLWVRLETPSEILRLSGIYENPTSGNFVAHGTASDAIDNYFFEMDRNTGEQTWPYTSDYGGDLDVLLSSYVSNSGVYYAGYGMFGPTLDLIRPTLSKFDFNGNLLWSKMYLRSPSQPSRLYNMDLLVENDTIINLGRGSFIDDDFSNSVMFFFKTDINGNLILAKRYSISSSTEVSGIKIIPIPNGYIAQGAFKENSLIFKKFVARLDKDGNVVWAKKINLSAGQIYTSKGTTIVADSFIVFATEWYQYNPTFDTDLIFGKIRLDGQTDLPNCNIFEDIVLNASNIQNPYDELSIPQATQSAHITSDLNTGNLTLNLQETAVPNCNCQALVQDSCNTQLTLFSEAPCPLQFDGTISVTPTCGVPPYNYHWQNDTVFTNQLTNLDVGTYFVTVTDVTGCITVDSVVLEAATRPAVMSEVQHASCFGVNDGALTIVADDPTLNFSFQGSTPSPQTFYDSLWGGGDQYFVIDTFGCEWVQFFQIDAPSKINLQLPNELEVPSCDSVQIEIPSAQPNWSYEWLPAASISCTDCPSPFVLPLSNTTYILTVTDTSGCKATDSIALKVDFEATALVPNAFSPNADGINDEFFVIGKCVESVQVLRVFDRWGEMVFEESNTPTNDPLYGWDGKFKGKDVNSDVYVYFAVIKMPNGSEVELRGDLTLLR
ncbi:MAG: gliding motility-associated C-terminal domain-containing protein [Saprospiraceae bacterium]|nr:gliding motility-associated C-terminal domain-containing protein [Saprospiraceae bacterium]MCF8252372.1 gliding motility-associated C-terminal domain-containing protein [Saprospiraceae bacterium]MCF8282213.1 gliding motility-associated C-terminal domain-containing protein [Bacteroidales bacterium]MCF8311836.1 gliding motility-associated C-terminal domain-containing protein [Saprospiraceae bacterium]MCF8442680.1 gliding motility-associated C-terminal domain-containing protein [Saprospiraceae 